MRKRKSSEDTNYVSDPVTANRTKLASSLIHELHSARVATAFMATRVEKGVFLLLHADDADVMLGALSDIKNHHFIRFHHVFSEDYRCALNPRVEKRLPDFLLLRSDRRTILLLSRLPLIID